MGLLPDAQVVQLLQEATRLRQQRKYKSCVYVLTELAVRDARCIEATHDIILALISTPESCVAAISMRKKICSVYHACPHVLEAMGVAMVRRRQAQRQAWEDYLGGLVNYGDNNDEDGDDASVEEEADEESVDEGHVRMTPPTTPPPLCNEDAIGPQEALRALRAAAAMGTGTPSLHLRALGALDAATSLAFNRYHYPMLNDAARNAAYSAAITGKLRELRAAHPGLPVHVVDIGSGTGLLSVYAARVDPLVRVTAYETCDVMRAACVDVLTAAGMSHAVAGDAVGDVARYHAHGGYAADRRDAGEMHAPSGKRRCLAGPDPAAPSCAGGAGERTDDGAGAQQDRLAESPQVLLVPLKSTHDPLFPRSPFSGGGRCGGGDAVPHATVVVTETFDCGLFGEGVAASVQHALRVLRPRSGSPAGGMGSVHVIPRRVELVGCVVDSAEVAAQLFVGEARALTIDGAQIAPAVGRGEMHESAYGVGRGDGEDFEPPPSDEPYYSERVVDLRVPPRPLSGVQRLAAIDMNTGEVATDRAVVTAHSDGEAVAVLAWMNVDMGLAAAAGGAEAAAATLTTAPPGYTDEGDSHSRAVCWDQAVFPLWAPTCVRRGDAIPPLAFALRKGFDGEAALHCGVATAGPHVLTHDEVRRLHDGGYWRRVAAALAAVNATGESGVLKALVGTEGACWHASLLARRWCARRAQGATDAGEADCTTLTEVPRVLAVDFTHPGPRKAAWTGEGIRRTHAGFTLRRCEAARVVAEDGRGEGGGIAAPTVEAAAPDVVCACVVLPSGLLEAGGGGGSAPHPHGSGGWELLRAARAAGVPTVPHAAALSLMLIDSPALLRMARVVEGDPALLGVAGVGRCLEAFQPRVYPGIDIHTLPHTALAAPFGGVDLLASTTALAADAASSEPPVIERTFSVEITAPGVIHAVPYFVELQTDPAGAHVVSTADPQHHWRVAAVLVPPRVVATGEIVQVAVAIGHGTVTVRLL